MTDNEKMREGQLWSFVHDSLHEAYKKLSTTGTRDEYYAKLDAIASKIADDVEARFLQAAKSVPVVGNVIGYLAGGTMMRRQIQGYECKPLVVQPTTSITEAELNWLLDTAQAYGEQMCKSHDLREVERIRAAIAGAEAIGEGMK